MGITSVFCKNLRLCIWNCILFFSYLLSIATSFQPRTIINTIYTTALASQKLSGLCLWSLIKPESSSTMVLFMCTGKHRAFPRCCTHPLACWWQALGCWLYSQAPVHGRGRLPAAAPQLPEMRFMQTGSSVMSQRTDRPRAYLPSTDIW